MSGIATAIVVSAVVGAVAAKKGAKAQENAAAAANTEEGRQFDLNRADLAPFRDAGVSVLPQLTEGLKPGGEFNRDFTIADFYANKDPGYQFRMDEGRKGVERGAAAGAGIYSGAAGKALERYGQDYASNGYQSAYGRYNNNVTNRFNRLSALAGTGQQATNTIAELGTQSSGRIADNLFGAGNAAAAGYVGAANAAGSGVQSLADFYRQQQFLKKIPTPVTRPGTGYPQNIG